MRFTYKTTIIACFLGYIVQAIVNNFIPLLFITLQDTYQIPLSQITLLVTINFSIQLLVDMLSSVFMDRIGYRASGVIAHICSAGGLILLTVLPNMMDPFVGILLSIMVYAVGGGIIEVLVSPVMESCPTDNKEKAMSFLHSFYCWGHAGVVLLSTIYFHFAGIENWTFKGPVFFGDTITVRITVSEKKASRSKPDRGLVKFFFEILNQDEKVVQEGIKVIMMKKSPEEIARQQTLA